MPVHRSIKAFLFRAEIPRAADMSSLGTDALNGGVAILADTSGISQYGLGVTLLPLCTRHVPFPILLALLQCHTPPLRILEHTSLQVHGLGTAEQRKVQVLATDRSVFGMVSVRERTILNPWA